MKGILSSLKGKIIVGAISVIVVVAVVVAVVILNAGHRSIAVEEVKGQTVVSSENGNVSDAYKGMHLISGDDISVKDEANMTMLLDADKYVFAQSGTHFWVKATGTSGKNGRTKIYLDKGSILNRLDTDLDKNESYEVETPNATMAVRGTIFRVHVYEDAKGELFTRIDVLEGEVKVTLKLEDGTVKDEYTILTAGQSALVRSNPEISEFVVGDEAETIPYEEYDKAMARYIVEIIDTSRPICIERNLFIHITELYRYYEELEEHIEEEQLAREATCAEEGLIEVYCNICDGVVKEESIEKVAHTESGWEVTKESTCKEAGEESLLCSVCNGVIETKEIEKQDHTYTRKNEDVEDGCVIHRTVQNVCSICGEVEVVRTTDTENHSYGDWETTAACTCEANGEQQQVCKICGDVVKQVLTASGHSFGAWATEVQATCTTNGSQARTCSVCSKKETSVITAAHSFGAWIVDFEATCEEDGLQYRICSSCQTREDSAIVATGQHSWMDVGDSHFFNELAPEEGTQSLVIPQMCEYCNTEGPEVTHNVKVRAVYNANGGVDYYECECECGMTGGIDNAT